MQDKQQLIEDFKHNKNIVDVLKAEVVMDGF